MKKLKLNLEDLKVESFNVNSQNDRIVGTINGNGLDGSVNPGCSIPAQQCEIPTDFRVSNYATCPTGPCCPTYYNTCPETCRYTCDDYTCDDPTYAQTCGGLEFGCTN